MIWVFLIFGLYIRNNIIKYFSLKAKKRWENFSFCFSPFREKQAFFCLISIHWRKRKKERRKRNKDNKKTYFGIEIFVADVTIKKKKAPANNVQCGLTYLKAFWTYSKLVTSFSCWTPLSFLKTPSPPDFPFSQWEKNEENKGNCNERKQKGNKEIDEARLFDFFLWPCFPFFFSFVFLQFPNFQKLFGAFFLISFYSFLFSSFLLFVPFSDFFLLFSLFLFLFFHFIFSLIFFFVFILVFLYILNTSHSHMIDKNKLLLTLLKRY